MMETVTDVGPISDDLRHKLHEATGEQINELLKSGEASPEQVLSAVVPLVKANWPRNGSDPQSSSANTATYYTESDSRTRTRQPLYMCGGWPTTTLTRTRRRRPQSQQDADCARTIHQG